MFARAGLRRPDEAEKRGILLFIQTPPGESNVSNHCCCLITSRLISRPSKTRRKTSDDARVRAFLRSRSRATPAHVPAMPSSPHATSEIHRFFQPLTARQPALLPSTLFRRPLARSTCHILSQTLFRGQAHIDSQQRTGIAY